MSDFQYRCVCDICGHRWEFPKETTESIVRATCAPCGHQGLFTVYTELKEKGDE